MGMINFLGNFIFVTAPSLGFLPQLLRRNITFAPLLSTILILANTFKLLYFNISIFSLEIFLQSLFLIIFHFILLSMNKNNLTILEEKIFVNKYTEKSYKKYGLFSLVFSLLMTIILGFYTLSRISKSVFY